MVFSFEQVEKCKITVQELALFGLDFVDFGNWPEGEKNRRYRVMIRVAASIFGYWKIATFLLAAVPDAAWRWRRRPSGLPTICRHALGATISNV